MKKSQLNRELGLIDIISLSTGAMISAGFFLLPGIAASQAGPSVFLAYLLAAFLILPAMFSMAELASATPKAGGAYFFIDRSLGPLFGTIGGIGNYLALIMKTSFALVGIGAYAVLFFDMPVRLTAIVFLMVFTVMNILGIKKTTGIQKVFVLLLVVILVFFAAEGLREIFFTPQSRLYLENYTPFLPNGFEGLMITTGLVFVSYLGLTQIASMSEEIKNPERNIPLGMILSLLLTTVIYVVGVFIMVGVIPPGQLLDDLAPASTAAQHVFSLVSPETGTFLVVFAAVSAFASTGNAGLMTASRFPLAMARDRLFPDMFARTGRFNTPVVSVLVTAAVMLAVITMLSESDIAKLASSFQLLIFILVNASVIVMRNSRIEAYDPGYLSPLYPWIQIFGILSSFFLIIYMGWGPGLFTMGVAGAAVAWYWYYARSRIKREGAIFHWFAILGKKEHKQLENEFLHILKEKGLRDGDPFGEMVVQAGITRLHRKRVAFRSLIGDVTSCFAKDIDGLDTRSVKREFLAVTGIDPALTIPRVSILYARAGNIDKPYLHIVTSLRGVRKPVAKGEISSEDNIRVLFFMISPGNKLKQQLRMLSRLMDIVERDRFVEDITSIENQREIKEYLLHNDRYISLQLEKGTPREVFIDKALKDVRLPGDVLVALLQRRDKIFSPRGDTILREGDIITVIGEPAGIRDLFSRYLHSEQE
ncbi:MAG: amino acid permease [Marinilabiliales bacterium]|nr:MAG: amino acid permease [Marinilabiliales bacterium]